MGVPEKRGERVKGADESNNGQKLPTFNEND